MKLSDAANKVIELSRKVRTYYDTELPKWHPNYPLVGADEEGPPPPPEQTELKEFLSGLPDEMIYQLTLIMYLGRGDYGTEDLSESYNTLKQTFADPKHAVTQMMEKAPLADYLADGLEELRRQNINVDRMPLKKARVRK
jgi:hypothetical protein